MPGTASPVPVTATAESISASTPLREVASWDGESQEIHKALAAAFKAGDYLGCIKNLRALQIEPQSYIDNLDKAIDSFPADLEHQKRCIRALRKTCGLYGILPTSYEVTSTFGKPGKRAFASGGFADVWRISDERNRDKMFAVKSLRVYEKDSTEKINKKYCKEVVVWKRTKHPNILSIEGVAPKLFEFCMVSQWMENGDMLPYLEKFPGANRLDLLIGITCGLDYLHRSDVVHGDLKGQNILIDAKGSPLLCDFGLCSITKNINSVNASTPNHGCTTRYRAPELLDIGVVTAGEKKATNESDMYSLSMVIVELTTGKEPFPGLDDPRVIVEISKGTRPPVPRPFEAPGMTPEVWKVAQKCWHRKAEKRPHANAVLQDLGRMKIANVDDKQEPRPSRITKFLRRGMFSD